MRKLYIGFSYTDKIGSYALRKYMHTPYSHVFFELDHQHLFGQNTIFHASMSSGVSYWSDNNFKKTNVKTHLYEIELPEDEYKALRAKLHNRAGEHYGFMQNLGIVLVDIAKNLGISMQNPFRKASNCSELVFYALVELHPELFLDFDPNTIRPDHIHLILQKYGYKDVLSDS